MWVSRVISIGVCYAVSWALGPFGTSDGPSDVAPRPIRLEHVLRTLLADAARTPEGVVAVAPQVSLRDLDPATVSREWTSQVPPRHAIEVDASGGSPIRILAPVWPGMTDPAIYRRVEPGLYVRALGRPERCGASVAFTVSYPGAYVIRESDAKLLQSAEKGAFFDFTPTTDDPAARVDWGLFRVRPRAIPGPIPVILVHGFTTNRWGEFIEWAATSAEAESFRAAFQLWDFNHPAEGIDAAIGFSSRFPAFHDSIAAELHGFIESARTSGVLVGDTRYLFPDGPFAMIAQSSGGLKVRAFLKHFPDEAGRVFAVATLAAPHTGTPLATPEWLRHSLSRIGCSEPNLTALLLQSAVGDLATTSYLRIDRQSDLDTGWGNSDAQGGFGIPEASFTIWRHGLCTVMLSPRDANQTAARTLPGYADTTFEPPQLRQTFCGGLDEIMPATRGEDCLDKFFLYGAYLAESNQWLAAVANGRKAYVEPGLEGCCTRWFEDSGLRVANACIALTASMGSDAPLGTYALNDGFIPLQSALLLDGTQTELIYETRRCQGYEYPVIPYRHRQDVIEQHTLANPERIRILRGWSHLDMMTGCYDRGTGHSTLFSMVADDLLSAAP
jgi:hypothetical protein